MTASPSRGADELDRSGRGRGDGALHGRWLERAAGLVAALLLAVGVLVLPTAARAAPGDVGLVGPSHAGTSTPTGAKRAESILWFNDGFWWGNLWDTRTSDFHIFRFDAAATHWVDTGVTTETRANTHHDVLWDGTTLYIASHLFVADGVPAAAGFPSTLRRYGYDTSTDTYRLLGSSQVNNQKTESLVIDKDTTGQVWATWQQGNQIYVNNTGTDGTTWGTPFPLPGGNVSVDDTSSLIAFGHGKVGVLWSKQGASAPASTDGFYWSVHVDGASRDAWSSPTAVVSGARQGDDHINLKWLDSSGGRVFAAVKTSFTSASQPLIQLLSMNPAGNWSTTTIATVAECPNRVILLIDEAAQRLRTFATYPKPAGTTNAGTCTTSGGAIYEKSTPLDNISFTTDKTPRIVDADQVVHNVSSTKQNLNNSRTGGASTTNSGLMIIADVAATSTYWYHFESGGAPPSPPDTTPPDTTITAGPVGTVAATDASFEFTSSEAGSTFECQLDAGVFGACTSPQVYAGLVAGSHTFSVRATDAAGNIDATPDTRTWTVAASDTTPPDTTITAGPVGTVAATDASFEFTSSEAGSTFECQLDAGVFGACTSPQVYAGLVAGPHTFSVRATDAAGNTDATPDTRTWTVAASDTTPPDTTITAGPVGTVAATDASFEFTSSEAGSTFECQLDAGVFGACTSPQVYAGLVAGPHTFSVRATDAAGNTDATPDTRTWTIEAAKGEGIVRRSFTTAVNTSASTTLRIGAPSGVAAGDVLVGCLALNGGSVDSSGVPPGWTLLAVQTALSNPKVYGYYKVATGTEPTEYTWTTSSTTSGGVIARYSGAVGLDTAASSASGAAAPSGTVGQVTTTTANAMLVGCMSVNSATATLSSPAGMTEVAETGARRFELADALQAAPGPSGNKTWTFSASREWAGWVVALRPR